MDTTPAGLGRPALSAEARLARFLFHAFKSGLDKDEVREMVMPLAVDASHPAAAAVQVRLPYERSVSTIYVDTSRLPCDHGRRT